MYKRLQTVGMFFVIFGNITAWQLHHTLTSIHHEVPKANKLFPQQFLFSATLSVIIITSFLICHEPFHLIVVRPASHSPGDPLQAPVINISSMVKRLRVAIGNGQPVHWYSQWGRKACAGQRRDDVIPAAIWSMWPMDLCKSLLQGGPRKLCWLPPHELTQLYFWMLCWLWFLARVKHLLPGNGWNDASGMPCCDEETMGYRHGDYTYPSP